MNFYLLQLVGKWISLIILSTMSFFGFEVQEKEYIISNDNLNKNLPVVTEVVEFKTNKTYNSSLTTTNVLVEGKNGLVFVDASGNHTILTEPISEEIEVGTSKQGVYNGIMTAYGADCKGCSKVGNVACKTNDNKKHSLINDGIYYNDSRYGEVRIMAAALSEFPCGTIIKVENSNIGDFIGIVMDTGSDMRKALEDGVYHFDLAFQTETDPVVRTITNKSGKIKYTVQRWGW